MIFSMNVTAKTLNVALNTIVNYDRIIIHKKIPNKTIQYEITLFSLDDIFKTFQYNKFEISWRKWFPSPQK